MWNQYKPEEIEVRSFEIIRENMREWTGSKEESWIVQRVIHSTADFSFEELLFFSENAVLIGMEALKKGANIFTDTNMALSGISKKTLQKNGGEVFCLISDDDIAKEAKERGITRAVVAVEKAVSMHPDAIFAIGNAPTALLRLVELIEENKAAPQLVIGAPVGFVNVEESKERLLGCDVPHIVVRGRKGGSTIAAAICNALLYGGNAPGVRGA